MIKKICTLLCLLLIASVFCVSSFAANGISVEVDGAPVVWTDAQPFIDSNNRTMVPLRAVADALGLQVSWNAATKTANFTGAYYYNGLKTEKTVSFTIGSNTAYYEFDEIEFSGYVVKTITGQINMDTAPIIENSRTYAPIRYLAEAFSATVSWNAATRTVGIEYPYIGGAYANMIDPVISILVDPENGYQYDLTKIRAVRAYVNSTEVEIDPDAPTMDNAVCGVMVYSETPLRAGDQVTVVFEVVLPGGRRLERSRTLYYSAENGFGWLRP